MGRCMHRVLSAIVLLVSITTAACSGSSSSPVGPSGVPSGSGATINGQVNGGSGLTTSAFRPTGLAPAAATTAGITVTVSGTGITTTVDPQGNFTLTGVPAGPVTLTFTGPGIHASLTIEVTGGEQITLAITVTGNQAVLESRNGSGGNGREGQLEGRITEIDPALQTIRVSGVLVEVGPTAVIRRASGATLLFTDLAVGDRVHVKGTRDAEGMDAREVKVQSQNTQPQLTLEGMVQGLGGTCPAITFTLNGTPVVADGGTFFKGVTCASLGNDELVQVRGRMSNGTFQASQIRAEEEDQEDDTEDNDDEDDDEEENEGGRGNGRGRGGQN